MGIFRNAAKAVVSKAIDNLNDSFYGSQGHTQEPASTKLDTDRSNYIGVSLTDDGYKTIQRKPMGELPVKVRKSRKQDGEHDYSVSLTDGTIVGYIIATDFSRSGAKTRGTSIAEVRRGFGSTSKAKRLYLRITDEAKEAAEMDTRISIPRNKWRGPDEGFDVMGGRILTRTKDDVTTYVIKAAGFSMCEITPDMRCYKTVAERANLMPRRIIANLKTGNFEPYYSVYLYY